jgi:hypothetical protein
MNADYFQRKLDQLKGKRDALKEELASYKERRTRAKKEEIRWERAKEFINKVGLETQKQLQFHISNLTTMAMEAVFDDPYKVKIEFTPRRGKTECDIWFERDGKKRDPLESGGFGAADIASFALRVASLSMDKDNLRKTLILDEPFKHLKGEEPNRRAIQMMKEISERLDIQIITISDERAPIHEIEKGADQVFKVTQKNEVSHIEEVL